MIEIPFASLFQTLELRFLRMQFSFKLRMKFYHELIALLNAGYSRGEALEVIWRLRTNDGKDTKSTLARIYTDIRLKLKNGLSFGEAARQWVSHDDYMILDTIEDSDEFATYLARFCKTLETNRKQNNSLAGLLGYPVLLVTMAYGVLVYFSSGIAPELSRLFPMDNWQGLAYWVFSTGSFLALILPVTICLAMIVPLITIISFPRWSSGLRYHADQLPIYSTYRSWTGAIFLQSMGCLMSSGLSAMEAIGKIIPNANPYLRDRLEMVRYHMMDGDNLGEALSKTGGSWPDETVNLSLRIFCQAPDFPKQLLVISENMLEERREILNRNIIVIRSVSFITVFSTMLAVVGAMYDIQSQITSSY
ncbi:MAG: type II secretion system F family protein [Rhodobacteraceae bacterium]|nr:type II secretion system F family protein [Paracoccaceae bacterium]